MQAHHGQLEAAFRQGLALPVKAQVRNADYDSTSQWDSVAHMLLVLAVEEAFQIQLSPAEVLELTSYRRAEAILNEHGIRLDE